MSFVRHLVRSLTVALIAAVSFPVLSAAQTKIPDNFLSSGPGGLAAGVVNECVIAGVASPCATDGLATTGTATAIGTVTWSPLVGASAAYIDTIGYQSTSFVINVPSGAAIVFESSADASNWVTQNVSAIGGNLQAGTWGTTSYLGLSAVNFNRYIRARVSSYTSGTITIQAALRANAGQTANQSVQINGTPSVAAGPKAAASLTVAGCTVGVTSAQCLAASTAVSSLTIQNVSPSVSSACTFGGTAALSSSGSFMLAPGQARQWGLNTSGVPSNALNCIAGAASTPLYVEYN